MFRTALAALVRSGRPALAADAERGTLKVPADDAKAPVAERFRMAAYSGDYKLALRYDLRHSGVTVYDLTFPSPVKIAIAENNTVHAEYFVPKGAGRKFPAVIVLDIMQGNAAHRPRRGDVAGPERRRGAGRAHGRTTARAARPAASSGSSRPTSSDTLDGVRQTRARLPVRRGVAGRPARGGRRQPRHRRHQPGKLRRRADGANEPRIKNVCLLLGGGGLVDAYYDHPKASRYRSGSTCSAGSSW